MQAARAAGVTAVLILFALNFPHQTVLFMFFIPMPMWVLAGVFFSSARFPDGLQPLIRFMPLTLLNDALRMTMIDGAAMLMTTFFARFAGGE